MRFKLTVNTGYFNHICVKSQTGEKHNFWAFPRFFRAIFCHIGNTDGFNFTQK